MATSLLRHPYLKKIEQAMIEGESHSSIARRFDIHRLAIFRYQKSDTFSERAKHVRIRVTHQKAPPTNEQKERVAEHKKQLIEQNEQVLTMSLSHYMNDALIQAKEILDEARKRDDWNAALRAIRELRECINLIGTVTGAFQQEAAININIDVSQEQERWGEIYRGLEARNAG